MSAPQPQTHAPPPPHHPQPAAPNAPRLPFVRRHPFFAFGAPFLALIVGSSFLLQGITSTRYELQDQKQGYMSPEELRQIEDRPFDIREFYYRLSLATSSHQDSSTLLPPAPIKNRRKPTPGKDLFARAEEDAENWEVKRVERPEGVAEWGRAPLSPEEQKWERERKLV